MALDVAWLKTHKPLVIAVGAAGGLGLVAALRKKHGGSTSSTTASPAATGAGMPGTFDSTGSDIAGQLGQFGAWQQQMLDDYGKKLTDTLAGLQGNGGQTAPPNPSGTPTTPAPAPASGGPVMANVLPGWHVDQWIRDLRKGYGPGAQLAAAHGGSTWITYDQIAALNPGLSGLINWTGSSDTTTNTFKQGATLRIA